MDWFWLNGEGPGDIPAWAYRELTVTLKVPAEKLAGLRAVEKAGYWRDLPVIFVRVFDPATAEDVVKVDDFMSLDGHPEIVRFEGYRDRADGSVTFSPPVPPQRPSAPPGSPSGPGR